MIGKGIGSTSESTISVVPASIHYTTHKPPVMKTADDEVCNESFLCSSFPRFGPLFGLWVVTFRQTYRYGRNKSVNIEAGLL